MNKKNSPINELNNYVEGRSYLSISRQRDAEGNEA